MSDNIGMDEINRIMVDYIHVGLNKAEICKKYHITSKLYNKIHTKYKLEDKKVAYVEKVLKKKLNGMVTTTAHGLTSGIEGMVRRIDKIDRHEEALEKEDKMLPAALSKERQSLTMDLFAITTRMDQEKRDKAGKLETVEVIFVDDKKKQVEGK